MVIICLSCSNSMCYNSTILELVIEKDLVLGKHKRTW